MHCGGHPLRASVRGRHTNILHVRPEYKSRVTERQRPLDALKYDWWKIKRGVGVIFSSNTWKIAFIIGDLEIRLSGQGALKLIILNLAIKKNEIF